MSPIRIVLADDHLLIRAGLQALLTTIPDFEVVGEAADGLEGVEIVERVQPDVCLMDITMPRLNGLQATERIRKQVRSCAVIIISMHVDDEFVQYAMRAGAKGYLPKDIESSHLESAIRAVMRGETCFPPLRTRLRLAGEDALRSPLPASHDSLNTLTPRQRDVLKLIAEGRTTKEAAKLLGVSAKTVESHRSQLMDRLATYDIPGLVRFAMRAGIVPLES